MGGRVVIVTGASSGIGEATARAFARAGDRVVVTARRTDRLQRLAAELPGSLAIPGDLTIAADIAGVVAGALDAFGRIDVLVNNAGRGGYGWLERLTEEEIHQTIAVNLTAPILLTRAVLPVMQAAGRGVIINVGSAAGRIGAPTLSIYNAAKFGLDGFSEALRREVAPQGIRVCVVHPGGVAGTEFGQTVRRAALGVSMPGRLRVTAEQVAAVLVALADRPRPRVVLPWASRAAVAVNTLLPSPVDRVMAATARRARRRDVDS